MAQEKNFSDDQTQKPLPKRERIKHLLIGSPKAVTGTIHLLQMQGGCKCG